MTPASVVAMIRALPDSARKAPEKKDTWNAASIDAQVRLATAEMLGLPVEERRQKAIGRTTIPRRWPDPAGSADLRPGGSISSTERSCDDRLHSRSKCPLLALVVLASLGADPDRPAPKFEGKSIPDPPRQKEPWTPPQTKLPRFLVSATAALFDQGMADPRGCEYREVEIGDGTILKTRGFVLPERAGEAGRFVVSWDGVVYPALSVGAAADLDKDVRTLAESMKRDREAAAAKHTNRFGNAGGFTFVYSRGGDVGWGGPSGADGRSPLKLCLLLRLGRADLAEAPLRRRDDLDPRGPGPRPDRLSHQLSHPRDGLGRRGLHPARGRPHAGRRRDRARCRPTALGVREGGRDEGRRDGLPAGPEPRVNNEVSVVFAVPPPAPRAAGRSRAAGEGARAGADPEARGRPLGADRRLDPRPRPDRRAADVVARRGQSRTVLRSCGR